jgi:HSP20 family protein
MTETTVEQHTGHWSEWPASGTPFDTRAMRVEEVEEDGCLVIRAELPGVDVEHDLDVEVRGHMLDIKASRTEPETTNAQGARHSEFRYGRFWRVLTLPPGAREADIEARYKDGILEVRVPVTDSAPVASRRIPVKQG